MDPRIPPNKPATLQFCTRCGHAVQPYAPSRVATSDACDYGTIPPGLDSQPHYWCSSCCEHWLAVNLLDTGTACPACHAFMPLAARRCGACGAALPGR